MKFREKLYIIRKERKMSQEDLAGIMGVSRQAVQRWEAGTASPDMSNLLAISEYFNVSLDSLLKEKEDLSLNETTAEKSSTSDSSLPGYAIKPDLIDRMKLHYEYKSKRALFGVPLVHINIGYGFHKAKGIIAIGNIAIGMVSVGILSLGLFSIGSFCLGLIALCAIGLGGMVVGGITVGVVAIGGIAIGMLSVGGMSIGVYSIGGVSIASHIAVGGNAYGYIAIGDKVKGIIEITIDSFDNISSKQVEQIIGQEYPKIWGPLAHLFATLFR